MVARKKRAPRIALVSVTMGHAQRGYERLFRDIFELLKQDVEITLIKGGGHAEGPRERVPALMRSTQKLLRLLPFRRVAGSEYQDYKADCLAFAISLIPELLRGKYDIVHLVDFPLGHIMRRCRPLFSGGRKLLMTNACCMLPEHYPVVSCMQEIAFPSYENAKKQSKGNAQICFLPIGLHADKFHQKESRAQLRETYGVPQDVFVILSVSALKRTHKRVDFVVQEVSRLRGDFLLWLDGNPEDNDLAKEAKQLLGSRCRISFVPSSKVRDLYQMADVMVHGALEEAFGLSIVEGLSTGLTVLTHKSEHFLWLTGSSDGLVDMSVTGLLTERLQAVMDCDLPGRERDESRMAQIRARFDWQVLKGRYLDLYRSLVCEE